MKFNKQYLTHVFLCILVFTIVFIRQYLEDEYSFLWSYLFRLLVLVLFVFYLYILVRKAKARRRARGD